MCLNSLKGFRNTESVRQNLYVEHNANFRGKQSESGKNGLAEPEWEWDGGGVRVEGGCVLWGKGRTDDAKLKN